jgi:hypothetical protein
MANRSAAPDSSLFGTVGARLALALITLAALGAHPAPRLASDITQAPLIIGSCALAGGTGSLNGQVTLPGPALLPSANVRLYTAEGRLVGSTTTDGAGMYRFNALGSGSYLLYARPGPSEPVGALYAPEWYDNRTHPADATPIEVYDGAATAANIQLTPGTQVSGRVAAAGGGPIPGVYVTIYDDQGETAASGRSDANGNYLTSPALNSGNYRVRFTSPDRPYLDDVAGITASAPNPFYLPALLQRAAQVTGRVTHAVTGLPVAADISIYGEEVSDYASTDSQGYYTLTAGLATGAYTIRFAPHADSQNLYGSSQVVTVTAPNTVTVNGTLTPGGQVTGRVTATGGAALPGATVLVIGDDFVSARYASADASGVYTATALPSGAYSVWVQKSGYVAEYYPDALDYDHRAAVVVTAPDATGGIDVELAPGGSLSGTVTAADTGLPLGDVAAIVYDATGEHVASDTVDSSGQYEVTGLPSGQYRLYFDPTSQGAGCGYQPEWYGDKASLDTADPVAVTAPGVTANVDAALARGSALLGRVVDAVGARPMGNVSALVYDASGRVVAEGATNFLGHYLTFPALPSGAYRVRFTDGDQGSIDEYFNDQLTWDTAEVVSVTAPNDVSGLSAALAPGGTIFGRVTAADTGAGLPDIVVTVYDAAGGPLGEAWTQSDGTYTILNGLPTGSYRLGFASAAGQLLPAQASAGARSDAARAARPGPLAPEGLPHGGFGFGYLPQFYNNKRTLAEADLVPVTAPGETGSIDVVLLRGVFLPLIQR